MSSKKTNTSKTASKNAAKKTANRSLTQAPAKNPVKRAVRKAPKRSSIGRDRKEIDAESRAAHQARAKLDAKAAQKREEARKTPLHERIEDSLIGSHPAFIGPTRLRFCLSRSKFATALTKAGLLPDFCHLEHVLTNLRAGTAVFLVSSENQVVTYSVYLSDVARAITGVFPKLAKDTRELYLVASDGERGVTAMTAASLVYERVPDFPRAHGASDEEDEIPF